MRRSIAGLVVLLALAWTMNATVGQAKSIPPGIVATPHDIGPENPLRKPLLDALRPTVETDLGQRVRLVVRSLRRQGDWVFIVARPQALSGKPIDFAKTRHAERLEAGIFDGDTFFALLKREAGPKLSREKWSVRDYVIGPTDVAYAAWPDDHGAPPALFGLPD